MAGVIEVVLAHVADVARGARGEVAHQQVGAVVRRVGARLLVHVHGQILRAFGELERLRVGHRPLVAARQVEQFEPPVGGGDPAPAASAGSRGRGRRCRAAAAPGAASRALRRTYVIAHPLRVVGERRARTHRNRVQLAGVELFDEQRVVALVRIVRVGHPGAVGRQVCGDDALPPAVVAHVEHLEILLRLNRRRRGRLAGAGAGLGGGGGGEKGGRREERERGRRAGGTTHGGLRNRARRVGRSSRHHHAGRYGSLQAGAERRPRVIGRAGAREAPRRRDSTPRRRARAACRAPCASPPAAGALHRDTR